MTHCDHRQLAHEVLQSEKISERDFRERISASVHVRGLLSSQLSRTCHWSCKGKRSVHTAHLLLMEYMYSKKSGVKLTHEDGMHGGLLYWSLHHYMATGSTRI